MLKRNIPFAPVIWLNIPRNLFSEDKFEGIPSPNPGSYIDKALQSLANASEYPLDLANENFLGVNLLNFSVSIISQ